MCLVGICWLCFWYTRLVLFYGLVDTWHAYTIIFPKWFTLDTYIGLKMRELLPSLRNDESLYESPACSLSNEFLRDRENYDCSGGDCSAECWGDPSSSVKIWLCSCSLSSMFMPCYDGWSGCSLFCDTSPPNLKWTCVTDEVPVIGARRDTAGCTLIGYWFWISGFIRC